MEKSTFLFPNRNTEEETSDRIKQRVVEARQRQEHRYRNEVVRFNSELDGKYLEKYCVLGKTEKILWKELCEQLDLSVRGAKRLLRVARTLADLGTKEKIGEEHLFEASLYKGINRKYWSVLPEGVKKGGRL